MTISTHGHVPTARTAVQTTDDPIGRLHAVAEMINVGVADRARDDARGQLDRARNHGVHLLAELADASDALDAIDRDPEPGEPLGDRVRRLIGAGTLAPVGGR